MISFKVAGYIRLSKEDKIKDESNSVTNQKLIIASYIKKNEDLELFDFYIDDGYSGTTFDRPEYKRMFKDIVEGKINTVIVKDLSRFGRNHIQSDDYIENILPGYNVRFISIIDEIDIQFKEGLTVITGETGAGKSIIIDAISLIFGARANSEIIAVDKDFAYISAALYLKEDVANYIYENYDIDVKDECIITRNISKTSKSYVKINGMIVPLHVLNEISSLLIDISSQNESQYLFNHKNHHNYYITQRGIL